MIWEVGGEIHGLPGDIETPGWAMFIKLIWSCSINTSVQLIILLKDEEQLFWLVMT